MELLVKRAMGGDGESFIQLMEQHRQSMLKVAWGFFSNQEDVADVMQQTILNAYEHIGELRQTRYFKTWLIRILINNCTKLYNSQKRMTDQDTVREEGYFDAYPGENSFFYLLSLLDRQDRVIFQLYFGQEYTTKEIGEFLGIKESTIRSRIRRGKEQLRKQIQREEWA
ncbi:MAG: sigma-70 family RNA polymerase sigma factor [Hungatella sp.]|jgi:RNA polymerase sigma factor (sigma-70 family)|nr:sigma-70 family RNA polymerase sigma factor [Hungatella sp.]